MGWIKIECEDTFPDFDVETKILVLLKEVYGEWFPRSYADRVVKGWWIPQRGAFVIEDVEDAVHLISHWQHLPEPPTD